MKVNLVDRVELPNLKLFKRGKVRDIYELDDRLLNWTRILKYWKAELWL